MTTDSVRGNKQLIHSSQDSRKQTSIVINSQIDSVLFGDGIKGMAQLGLVNQIMLHNRSQMQSGLVTLMCD